MKLISYHIKKGEVVIGTEERYFVFFKRVQWWMGVFDARNNKVIWSNIDQRKQPTKQEEKLLDGFLKTVTSKSFVSSMAIQHCIVV